MNASQPKDMSVQNFDDAKKKIADITAYGDPDYWRLVWKETLPNGAGMKSVKAAVTGRGLTLQVSMQRGTAVSESVAYVDGLSPDQMPKVETGSPEHSTFWKPIGGASSAAQGWEKGSEAFELPDGVLLHTFTIQSGNISNAVQFIPDGALKQADDGKTYSIGTL